MFGAELTENKVGCFDARAKSLGYQEEVLKENISGELVVYQIEDDPTAYIFSNNFYQNH